MDWAKQLEQDHKPKGNLPDGSDWFTINELREKSGWGKDKSYAFIKNKIESNEVEMFRGSEYSEPHNQLVRRIWYRFKPLK